MAKDLPMLQQKKGCANLILIVFQKTEMDSSGSAQMATEFVVIILSQVLLPISQKNKVWAVMLFNVFQKINLGTFGSVKGLEAFAVTIPPQAGLPKLMDVSVVRLWTSKKIKRGTSGSSICITGCAVMTENPIHILQRLSLIHISEPTRPYQISYAVFCLKKHRQ